jgi:hypothetical protein
MGTPETTRPAFGPEAQRRREHKAKRAAAMKAAAAEALDFGKPAPRVNDSLEAGVTEALATVNERVALRTARDPRAVQEAQRALAAKKAELRGQQPAGQPQRRTPTIDEYLESLSQGQRETIEHSDWFHGLDERHQADVRRRLAALEEIEAEAEYEFEVWKEEHELAALEDTEPWPEQEEEEQPDFYAAGLARQSEQVNADYSDNVEDGYELEGEVDE